METYSLQIALFLGKQIIRPDEIYLELNKKTGGIFDSVPTIIPIPVEAPPEIPIVQMSDTQSRFKCTIARNRVDIYLNMDLNDTKEKKEVDNMKFFDLSKKLVNYIISINSIIRIGMVSDSFFETNEPIKVISEKYLKSSENMDEISFRYNKKKFEFSIWFNDVIEVYSNVLLNKNESKPGVSIRRDINSVLSNGLNINKNTCTLIIDHFSKDLLSDRIKELI